MREILSSQNCCPEACKDLRRISAFFYYLLLYVYCVCGFFVFCFFLGGLLKINFVPRQNYQIKFTCLFSEAGAVYDSEGSLNGSLSLHVVGSDAAKKAIICKENERRLRSQLNFAKPCRRMGNVRPKVWYPILLANVKGVASLAGIVYPDCGHDTAPVRGMFIF